MLAAAQERQQVRQRDMNEATVARWPGSLSSAARARSRGWDGVHAFCAYRRYKQNAWNR